MYNYHILLAVFDSPFLCSLFLSVTLLSKSFKVKAKARLVLVRHQIGITAFLMLPGLVLPILDQL